MKTFIVALQASTPEQEETFRKWITDSALGYWHWIPNFWIIQSFQDTYSTAIIRDKITETFNGMDTLVVEIGEKGSIMWSGYGPKTEQRNMFDWMSKNL